MKGNPLAIDQVLKQYDGYISTCACCEYVDEYGETVKSIDSDLKGHLQTVLILALPKFRLESDSNDK